MYLQGNNNEVHCLTAAFCVRIVANKCYFAHAHPLMLPVAAKNIWTDRRRLRLWLWCNWAYYKQMSIMPRLPCCLASKSQYITYFWSLVLHPPLKVFWHEAAAAFYEYAALALYLHMLSVISFMSSVHNDRIYFASCHASFTTINVPSTSFIFNE